MLPHGQIKSSLDDFEKNQSIEQFWRSTGLTYISLGVSEKPELGLPRWSNSKDSKLLMQRAWIRPLVRELDPAGCN